MKLSVLTIALCALLLGGCTVTVVDSRLTREEVATAFQQRDQVLNVEFDKYGQAIKALSETILRIDGRLKVLEPKKENKK